MSDQEIKVLITVESARALKEFEIITATSKKLREELLNLVNTAYQNGQGLAKVADQVRASSAQMKQSFSESLQLFLKYEKAVEKLQSK